MTQNLIQNLILAITLVVAFLLCISALIIGIKIGIEIGKGKLPTVTLNPVKKVIQAVEQHEAKKEETKLADELTDVMSASRESMLKAIKEVK